MAQSSNVFLIETGEQLDDDAIRKIVESAEDLVTNGWTHLAVVVSRERISLYRNAANLISYAGGLGFWGRVKFFWNFAVRGKVYTMGAWFKWS